jgi:peptide/nickel transport system substrate-binding protein
MLALCVCAPTAFAAQDRLVVALDTKYASMDLYGSSQTNVFNLYLLISDPLLERDEKDFGVRPHLVTEWKSVSPTVWEFKLREDVKFHNGKELTGEAVRFTLMDWILKSERKSPLASGFKWIKDVEVTGKHSFRIHCQEPYPLVLDRLTYVFPYEPTYATEKDPAYLAENPMGTGPYRFVKWERGASLEITANEAYWQKGVPKIKNILFRIIPEISTRLAELRSGGVDLVVNMDPDKVAQVENDPNLKIISSPTYRTNFYQFDASGRASETPLKDKRVRQAIWHAIDRKAIIKTVLNNQAEPLETPVTRFHFGYDPSLKGYEYDPGKAKALLKEAGYPDGFTIDVWQYYNIQNQFNQAAMGYLGKVGIKVNLKDYRGNIGQLITMRNTGKVTGIGNYAWGSLFIFDSDAVLSAWFMSSAPMCYNPDPELEGWLKEAGSILDQSKRKELYVQAQRRIIEEAYWMPLFLQYQVCAAKKGLELSASPAEMLRLHHASWAK